MTDDEFTLDELASAYLDDEVTADERAEIEADPTALARVEALRAVRATLQADLGQLDDAALEAALVTALAAADDTSTASAGPSVPPPTDLAAARRRRAGRIWKPVLAVAGAAAIGVGVISGIANLNSGSGDNETAGEVAVTVAASSDQDAADAAGAAPAESEAATDQAEGGAEPSRETISEIGPADVSDAPLLSEQPDAGSAAETTTAAATQSAVDAPALTTEKQLAAFAAETEQRTAAAPPPSATSRPSPSASRCPGLGISIGAVVWQGTLGDLYLRESTGEDSGSFVGVATVATVDCVVLVSVQVP